MRSIICCMLCLLLLLTAPFCQARKPKPASATQKAVQVSEVPDPAALPAIQEITQIRWTVLTNADINDSWLRLVLEVTGPVEVDGAIINTPAPYLAVNVKGVIPGSIENPLNLDGQIANNIELSTDGKNSRLMIALLTSFENSDCRIFTLPSDVSTNKPFRVIIDISDPAPPPGFSFTPGLKDKIIVIDPGHGGSDTGAIGPGGTMEKTINLAVAADLKALLEKAGAKVSLTRQEDCDVFGPDASARDELNARVVIAANNKADLFISIHANASPNPLAHGTSTYYFRKTSYDALLAYNIQAGMVRAGGLKNRSFFPAKFYVVRHTGMPAALVELAFLSNAEEEKLLNDPRFQLKMAQGIMEGLDRFFAQASVPKSNPE